ncbi:MAG: hypothetical protein COS89_00865 [Deltaproteobacteria bacterium CG07_land_8_20_14_0_80_38_7]|nr:MAG: hypothetical protein COS89_00865 [Deltaproteobacteria bacterium CG07_land_8_20_14_0_80_38_7]
MPLAHAITKKYFIFTMAIVAALLITNIALCSPPPLSNISKQGPKMRVAVANFGTTDKFASVYGGWNIGGGLAAQLVTELIKTERVVVVERAILSKVLIEQELGESHLISPLTRNPTGHLLGVDYLIVGEVTEFEEREMGAGLAAKIFGVKVGGQISAAMVGVDIRIVDTRTGEILYSHYSKGRAWEKAGGAKVDYKVIDFGGDAFHKTPLGKATRRAIDDAMSFVLGIIDKNAEEFSWLGRVVDVEGNIIYINAGIGDSINNGDIFKVTHVRKVLADPETNQVIGLLEDNLGKAEAVYTDKKYTKARIIGNYRPTIGDLVRFANDSKQTLNDYQEKPVGYEVMY